MGLFNLLDKAIPVFGQTFDVSLNWIGQLIRWMVAGIGIVGVGIILFSLCLKFIVLPFDVYQRVAMRKQNQKMKDQKERMEKLQKQYANDKQMYNQKLMEMYKENGISMFSSCLPMILSMVIFFVAIGAFNAYARYSSIDNYNGMVASYKTEIRANCPDLEDENITIDGNKIVVKGTESDATAYIYYKLDNKENYTAETAKADVKAYIEKQIQEDTITEYYIDSAKVSANAELISEIKKLIPADADLSTAEKQTAATEQAMYDYFVNKAQEKVRVDYEENGAEKTKFLWIKNIWMTDASYKSPVAEDFTTFETEIKTAKFRIDGEKVKYGDLGSETGTLVYTADAYDMITKKLDAPKDAANGYYILIVLSIGTILLQQFVMMRSQKEQQKYSTVDGQGASQQKMMMVVMTVMFAIFSFMYSAAFSIYMVTSNIFSMLSTIIINKIVDRKMEKQEATTTAVKMDNRRLSRIEAAKNAGKTSAQNTRERKNKDGK